MTKKIILVTGATDGIGLETSKRLASLGHHILLHGRSIQKSESVLQSLTGEFKHAQLESFVADLSQMVEVEELARAVIAKHSKLDVLINNAGVFMTPNPVTAKGLDLRFVVNTIAPYLLTKRLLPIMGPDGRVINLSSAAQSSVDPRALAGQSRLPDGEAYAQSKLAITMWTRKLSDSLGSEGPSMIAVNPGSFLGSKMVKEAYGRAGKDLSIGADILTRAALSDEFATARGKYFDNDSGRFASPHPDVFDGDKCQEVIETIEALLAGEIS
tara:strand:- start:159642 stop:160454 length:813 start_codon:yes stop_codon:yes gene_type:complete